MARRSAVVERERATMRRETAKLRRLGAKLERSAVVEWLERELAVATAKKERLRQRIDELMGTREWTKTGRLAFEHELEFQTERVIKRLLRKARKAPAAGAKGG